MSPTPEEIKKAHQVLFDQGMEVRKAVVGPEHVEKSMAGVSDFAMPIQHIVTEACWGAIWTRPGLERKTRSMINIAMLSALNRYLSVCLSHTYTLSLRLFLHLEVLWLFLHRRPQPEQWPAAELDGFHFWSGILRRDLQDDASGPALSL